MTPDRVVMARATARAAVRAALSALRSARSRTPSAGPRQCVLPDGRTVVVQPGAGRRPAAAYGLDVTVLTCAGERLGEFWTHADAGTSTYEIVPRLDVDPGSGAAGDDPAVTAALHLVVDEVRTASPELRLAVRRALDPLVGGPSDAVLVGLGFTHVATFPGDVASPQAWAGEQRWELTGDPPAPG